MKCSILMTSAFAFLSHVVLANMHDTGNERLLESTTSSNEAKALVASCPSCQRTSNDREERFINTFIDKIKSTLDGDGIFGTLFEKLTSLFQRDQDDVSVDIVLPILTTSSTRFTSLAEKIREESLNVDPASEGYDFIVSVTDFSATNMESITILLDSISNQLKDVETVTVDLLLCQLIDIIGFVNDSFLPNLISIATLVDDTIENRLSIAIADRLGSNVDMSDPSSMCSVENYDNSLSKITSMNAINALNLEEKKLLISTHRITDMTKQIFCFDIIGVIFRILFVAATSIVSLFEGLINALFNSGIFFLPGIAIIVIFALTASVFIIFASLLLVALLVNVILLGGIFGCNNREIGIPEDVLSNIVDSPFQDLIMYLQQSNNDSFTKEDFECEMESLVCKTSFLERSFPL